MCLGFFCFLKQKTAYEVRISDWSSDVCSSDLTMDDMGHGMMMGGGMDHSMAGMSGGAMAGMSHAGMDHSNMGHAEMAKSGTSSQSGMDHSRSEEHTSELQSLMRISYAVFCLKKKNKNKDIKETIKEI